ncbi:MAG: phage portal protein [Thermoguttaceae bacterium]|nr:phage portal protein [Thermoguttaceae bacterium]
MTYFIHPMQYLFDDEERWIRADGTGSLNAGRLDSEEALEDARQSCRQLALTNEFAICGHENRISFVVGSGHHVSAEPLSGREVSRETVKLAQEWLEDFMQENDWFRRQQEIQRRKDRDGEAFLRIFVNSEGQTAVRFVEPEDVFTPSELSANGMVAGDHTLRNGGVSGNGEISGEVGSQESGVVNFGIQTDAADAESIQGFWIRGEFVPASEIQHRKANADFAVPRGLPLFYPVRKNLQRAEKLLRNMSVVAEVQSAIAIIRKHSGGSRLGIESFAASAADASFHVPGGWGTSDGPRSLFYRHYSPGTILDTSAGVEYQFPVAAVDAGRYIQVLQAELRAIASRLVMPEFMLTADASNASYSSTMIAEGPAVRMFERLQKELISEDIQLFRRVLLHGVQAGRLPVQVLTDVRISVIPPRLSVRDRLEEVQAGKILVELGAMSVEELRARLGT